MEGRGERWWRWFRRDRGEEMGGRPAADGRRQGREDKDGSGRGGGENKEGGKRGGCGARQQRRREATAEKATAVPSREATGYGNGGKRRGSWGMRGRCHGENGRGRWWSATTSATRTGRRKKGRRRWAVLVERKRGGKGDREAAVDDEGRQGRSRAAAEEKGRGRKERRWTAVDPAMTAVLAMEEEVAGRHRSSGGRWVTSERQPGEQRQRKKRGFRSLPKEKRRPKTETRATWPRSTANSLGDGGEAKRKKLWISTVSVRRLGKSAPVLGEEGTGMEARLRRRLGARRRRRMESGHGRLWKTAGVEEERGRNKLN